MVVWGFVCFSVVHVAKYVEAHAVECSGQAFYAYCQEGLDAYNRLIGLRVLASHSALRKDELLALELHFVCKPFEIADCRSSACQAAGRQYYVWSILTHRKQSLRLKSSQRYPRQKSRLT